MDSAQESSATDVLTSKPSANATLSMSLDNAFTQAISLYQHGKRQDAREIFEKILAVKPDSVPVLQVLAVINHEEGRWQTALTQLEQALLIEPDNPSLLFDKVQLLTEQKFNKEASLLLDKLLAAAPNHPELLQLKQKLDNSMSHLSKKNKLNTKDCANGAMQKEIDETLQLAQQMLQQDNTEQAQMLYQAVINLAGEQPCALRGLAKVQIKNEQFALARQTLLRSIAQEKPAQEALVLLAHSEIKLKLYEDARKHSELGIDLYPTNRTCYCLLLQTLEKMGKIEQAYNKAKQFIQLFPNDDDIYYRFASNSFLLLRKRHNFTKEAILACESHLSKAYQLADEQSRLQLSTYIAELAYYKGDATKAAALLEHYLEQHPDDLDAKFHSNFIYRTLEEWQKHYDCNEVGLDNGSRISYSGPCPRWDLSRPKDDVVLIMPEQGVGDELLYCHNIGLVLENAKKVFVACDPRLENFITNAYPRAVVVPIERTENHNIFMPPQVLDEMTSWIPGASLAKICFEHFERHIYQASYAQLSQPLMQKGAQLVAMLRQQNPNARLVGLCWRSGLANAARNIHYLSLKELGYLLKQFSNTVFVNLQYGDCAKELKKVHKQTGITIHQLDLDLKNDFETSAALIANLDAVVTAGTAVHRLTCAVGTPCYTFFASTLSSNPLEARALFCPKEIGFFYPPLLDDKSAMLTAIAQKIEQDLPL
ncbi:MAG: tetratricopeptide repeat protein [Vibrionaceae bacterium]